MAVQCNFSSRHVVNKPGLQNVGRLDVTMKDLHCCTSSEKKKRVSWCLRVSPPSMHSMHFALGVWWCRCDRPQAASYATQIRSRHGKAYQLGFLPHERDDAFRESHEKLRPQIVKTHLLQREHKGKSELSQRRNGEL